MNTLVQRRARKPDAQGFDEVRITTVPRYKTSGLSGSEWRISAKVEFLRKGKVIYEDSRHDVASAIKFLTWSEAVAHDEGKMYFAGEGNLCDQEGCAEQATVTYRIKNKYCQEDHEPTEYKKEDAPIRLFCSRHSKRGDCGLDDNDSNYEIVEGEITEPNEQDVKPATFGGVIDLGPLV